MKNRIKNAALRATNHVRDHKFAYVASGVAIAMTALVVRNNRAYIEFLESKGIDPMEYFNTEMFEELNS